MSTSRDHICHNKLLPVETHALVLDNGQETTATEGLRVGLTLDLQNIERQKSNLTDTDQTMSTAVKKSFLSFT